MIPPITEPFIVLTEEECWGIIAALVFVALDMLIGVICAVVRKDFQSCKMREGLGHKIVLILAIMLAFVAQGFTGHVSGLAFDVPLIVPVCVYICVMEVASILETLRDTNPALADSPIMSLFEIKEDDE